MRLATSVQQPQGTWIEIAEELRTFSLLGISNLLVPAFRGNEDQALEFALAIREKITDTQELRIIDAHTPVFTVHFDGLDRIPAGPNGRSCVINVNFRSQILTVDPEHDTLTASAMLERPDPTKTEVFIVPNSLLFHKELRYIGDRQRGLFGRFK